MLTELHFRQESINGWIRRSVVISREEKKDITLWFEAPERYADWLAKDEEPLLRLALFFIMEVGGECRIHAEIDRLLLDNLTEHMRIWQLWCPGTYFCPTLIPDAIVDRLPHSDRSEAICAFSGGLDAAYALMTHHSGYWGNLSLKVPAAVFIHGADIPLSDQKGYDYAFARADESLKEIGVELIPVRTNCREYPDDWSYSHLSGVTAALSLFSGRFSRGILGSNDVATRAMIEAFIPYGMNYVTDHCFDSSSFTCRAIGCDVTRTQRCAVVSRFPGIMKNLRFCWRLDAGGRNCGVCEKCLRTALNFMASGYKGELPFEQPFSMDTLRKMKIDNYFNFNLMSDVLNIDSQTHGLPDEVRRILKSKLSKVKAIHRTPHGMAPKDETMLALRLRAARYDLICKLSKGKRKQKYEHKLEVVHGQIKHLQEGGH